MKCYQIARYEMLMITNVLVVDAVSFFIYSSLLYYLVAIYSKCVKFDSDTGLRII